MDSTNKSETLQLQSQIFRHYKGKYYRKLGEAIHSETLQSYIYYECLYENPSGRFWIRPQELFEGNLENGAPRFLHLSVVISRTTMESSGAEELSELDRILEPLVIQTLGSYDQVRIHQRIRAQESVTLWTAQFEEKIVGYKLGYSEGPEIYYSWLGGVLPAYRRYGIAQALIDAQHAWARNQKFLAIKTKTTLDRLAMLRLNLKNGFEIEGIDATDPAQTKIVLTKNLAKA